MVIASYYAEIRRAIDRQQIDPKVLEQLVFWDEHGNPIGHLVQVARKTYYGGGTTPSETDDPAPDAGWPDLPRHWKLFSFVLPRTARERYFAHSYEDMVIAYGEATKLVRTPGERRWILFSFGLRSVGLYTGSIAAIGRDVAVSAMRWIAILTMGRQAAGRLIAWIEKMLIGS